jgi:hypothetical protein
LNSFFYETILLFFDKTFSDEKSLDEFRKTGLIVDHVYIVTDVYAEGSKLRLIRLRNPWGKTEWKGAWADDSSNWNKISKEKKEKLKFGSLNDGNFWMSYADWLVHFDTCEVCNLTPQMLGDINKKHLNDHKDQSVRFFSIHFSYFNL